MISKPTFVERRIRRTHDVGNDEHRATLHRAFEHAVEFRVGLGRIGPIVRRTRFLLRRRADEGELLDPRDIVWIRAMQIRAGNLLLVQLDQRLPAGRLDRAGSRFPAPNRRTRKYFRAG